MKRFYLLIISFFLCIIAFIVIHNYSNITNLINNISLENPDPKYNLNANEVATNTKKTVSFGDVAKSGSFHIKILNASEINCLQFDNKTFKPNSSNKYILISFRVRNSSKSTSELYFCEYTLKNNKTNQVYYFSDPYFKIISELCQANKNDKNLAFFGNIKSGLIKNVYILFEVPETEKLDDLVLESSTAYFKLK